MGNLPIRAILENGDHSHNYIDCGWPYADVLRRGRSRIGISTSWPGPICPILKNVGLEIEKLSGL